MLIYEVNLAVNADVYPVYVVWLRAHIKEILEIRGFIKAQLYQEKIDSQDKINLVVHYYIDTEDHLHDYFANHAAAMRADAAQRFPNQFQVTRRVLILQGEELVLHVGQ